MSITICLFLSNNCICSIWLVQQTTTFSYGNESHASFLISFLENKKAQKPYDIWVFGVGIQIGCITWLHRWDFCRLRLLPSPVAWSKRAQSAASHPFLPALWGIATRKRYLIVFACSLPPWEVVAAIQNPASKARKRTDTRSGVFSRANLRPVAVACRSLSPRHYAYTRLCLLQLWATP